MPLTKTILEIKEVLPKLVSNTNANSNLPNLQAAEEKYLVPIIGRTFYNDLTAKYNAAPPTLNADELQAVKHCRLMTVSYAYLDELAATHVLITDAGVRTAATANLNKAVGWEYKELKRFLFERALDGMEVLLQYLWSKKQTFALWVASDEYKRFSGGLIRTGTDFNEHYRLHQPMRTFYALKSMLDDVQDVYVQETIGAALTKYFAEKEEATAAEASALRKLKKALCFFTVMRSCEHLPVRFGDSGFTVVSEVMGGDREGEDAGRSNASVQLIEMKRKACEREGRNYLARARYELATLRKDATAAAEFATAYDAGPMKTYLDPKDVKSGNERRRIFRM